MKAFGAFTILASSIIKVYFAVKLKKSKWPKKSYIRLGPYSFEFSVYHKEFVYFHAFCYIGSKSIRAF